MMNKYEFYTEPRKHQYKTINFAMNSKNRRVNFWLDIGTGKTLSAIYSACLWGTRSALVICPNSADETWRKQIVEHTNLKYIDLSSYVDGYKSAAERRSLLKEKADFYLINYEGLKSIYARKVIIDEKSGRKKSVIDFDSFNNLPFNCLIVDESHSFSNYDALHTKIGCQLSMRMKQVLMLTGTPTDDRLMGLWSQFYVLDQGKTLGSSFYGYLQRYFKPKLMQYRTKSFTKWFPKKNAMNEIMERAAGCTIRFDREQCFNLPPLICHITERR